MKSKKELVRALLRDEKEEFSDEELIQMLLEANVSVNLNAKDKEKTTPGQRAADAVAKFAGSWGFIISFLVVMAIWMAINVLLETKAFDSYPFILLNLVLSCVAAVQAPLIMMSQNRQEQKDRARAENDYRVNLKNEFLIGEIYKRVDRIAAAQSKILKALEAKEQTGREK
ncbi:MAG: DUF1003 domain-containing protein [Oscillospiraceae bacterium]|nr:DUF1003 domain-containing protein [Oscillospiraceae bacterium]